VVKYNKRERIFDQSFYHLLLLRRERWDCEIVPWVWVYVPLENREGMPLAARLDLVAMGRVEGIILALVMVRSGCCCLAAGGSAE